MTKNKFISTGLNTAYSLVTPKDSVKLYKKWAKTYDKDFALSSNYLSPFKIANYYNKYFKDTDKPILDVGAGTGLVGECLYKKNHRKIIAIDISSEMLKKAELKKCYVKLIKADLTKKIPLKNDTIGGVVSAGTFTHGHVGPDALDELIRITKPGGLFVLSIHKKLFIKGGFQDKFKEIKKMINTPIFKIFNIYGQNHDKNHGKDKALATIFRKKNSSKL